MLKCAGTLRPKFVCPHLPAQLDSFLNLVKCRMPALFALRTQYLAMKADLDHCVATSSATLAMDGNVSVITVGVADVLFLATATTTCPKRIGAAASVGRWQHERYMAISLE